MTARLLTRDEARAYCGGVDPERIAPGRRFGRSVRWDRDEINAALDAPWKRADASESEGSNDGFNLEERVNRAS